MFSNAVKILKKISLNVILLRWNCPVGNIGDEVAVNVKAARVLRDLYGFESPGIALLYFPNASIWFNNYFFK